MPHRRTRSPRRARRRRTRRGNTAVYFGLAMFVIGGFAAFAVEYAFLRHVDRQLEGVSAAASHAALVEMEQPTWTLDSARQAAVAVTDGSVVANQPYTLDPAEVEFGYYDDTDGFTATEDQAQVNAVRVQLEMSGVGLGFGRAFLGRDHTVSTCAAVAYGDGNAASGTDNGDGLVGGHFDYDATAAIDKCEDDTVCTGSQGSGNWGTTTHYHEYDDIFDLTYTDMLSGLGGALVPSDCIDETGTITDCSSSGTRFLPEDQPFKIIVLNAELSPGGWLTVNGADYDVTGYDDTPLSYLPTYTLSGSSYTRLTELVMNFDVDSIADCELIGTATPRVRNNVPGIHGEWRSGALTVQLVRPDAVMTAGTSAGGHDAVATEDDGLIFEGTFFWDWAGNAYTQSTAEGWQADWDALECPEPEFVSDAPGGSVCG